MDALKRRGYNPRQRRWGRCSLTNCPHIFGLYYKRYSQKVGLPPGTLVYTGEERTDPVRITLIDYDETHLHEEEAQTIEACLPFMDTTVSTFFIPLTFIAGIYGMNFRFMPELEVRWGYPVVLLVMAGIGIGMFVYFKLRKWL